MAANANVARIAPSNNTGAAKLEKKIASLLNFGADARIDLYERLAEFDTNGKDLGSALRKQYQRFKKRKDMRHSVWLDLVSEVSAGGKLSKAMAPYVPPTERLAIAAGEETGNYAEGFTMAAYIATSVSELRSAIVGTLLYPAILGFLFIVLMYFVSWQLVPAMLNIAPVEEWPALSYSLYVFSSGIKLFGLWVLIGTIGIAVANIISFGRFVGPVREKLDKLWPVNVVYRKVQGAMFVVILAAMQRGGIPLDAALRDIRAVATPWLRNHIEIFQRRLSAGRTPSEAIATGLLDQDVIDTLEDYDESGSFSKALEIVGKNVVKRTIKSVKAVASVFSALMMLGVAGGIVWTYASMAFLVMGMNNQTPGP